MRRNHSISKSVQFKLKEAPRAKRTSLISSSINTFIKSENQRFGERKGP